MEFTVKAISAILKSVASNKIGNEFGNEIAGIFIDEVTGKGIDKIKDFINEGKVKIERILSKENMESMNIPGDNIDYVVAEIKDLFSRIDITDEVLIQCECNRESLSSFLWVEYCKSKNGYVENQSSIRQSLFVIAETLGKLICESKKFDKALMVHTNNTVYDVKMEIRDRFDILEENQKIIIQQISEENIINQDKKFQNNKKQEYIKIWNSRLFLHVNNDENPITLKEAFIVPDYKMYKEINRMGFFSDDTLDTIIEKFVKYNKTSDMLIYGVPGIGKSTITSWLANKYRKDDEYIILRFRDWDNEELEKGLLKAICSTLVCKKRDLENKILILDGFDEMKALDIRENILDSFFNDINDFDNIKCIMTSRTGYTSFDNFRNILELQNFDINKTEEFCKKITGKGIDKKEKVESNLEVLGIPVILYLAIMSNVDISENPTKAELYNRIFSKKGGIFDRFFDGDVEYGRGEQILRNSENIKKYLRFLCEIAFRMFEENSLSIQRMKCEIPVLEFEKKAVSILEFPIKHLFENVETNVEFIHKSIFEYFLAEYFFVSIKNGIGLSIEKFAGILGNLFKNNIMFREVLEFFRFKIEDSDLKNKFAVVNDTFQLMLRDGMTYYTNECYRNIMDCEMNVFVNMLELLHLWEFRDILMLEESVIKYISYNYKIRLNLGRVDLRRVDLRGVDLKRLDLRGADLSQANLGGTNLIGANLIGTNLIGANLIGANLIEADLRGTNFREADLRRADLIEANLIEADLKGADLIEADLRRANLYSSDLSETNLSGADLGGADLREANLCRSDLSGANLREANLSGANLREANLSGANLREADIYGIDLNGTILDESNAKYLNKHYLDMTKTYVSLGGRVIAYEEYYKRKAPILSNFFPK